MAREFDHERMQVYLRIVAMNNEMRPIFRQRFWPEYFSLEQLWRASGSVAYNIGEGAGEFSAGDKIRFYRMSRRSAAECDTILTHIDGMRPWRIDIPGIREQLRVIAMMETRLINAIERRNRGNM